MKMWDILGWNIGTKMRKSTWNPSCFVYYEPDKNKFIKSDGAVDYVFDKLEDICKDDWIPYSELKKKVKVTMYRRILKTDSIVNTGVWCDRKLSVVLDQIGWETKEIEYEEL